MLRRLIILACSIPLVACLDSGPKEKDVERLFMEHARSMGSFARQPSKVVVTNLKCNSNQGVYNCSYDMDIHYPTSSQAGKEASRVLAKKGETVRLERAGDLWAVKYF